MSRIFLLNPAERDAQGYRGLAISLSIVAFLLLWNYLSRRRRAERPRRPVTEEAEKSEAPEKPPDLPSETPPPKKKSWAGGILGAVLIFLSKAKSFLLIGLKSLKYVKTAGTMVLMMWAYSQRLGWPYSIGFVLLILIHELGHGFAGKLLGYEMSAPVFIPFVGAFISLKDKPKTQFQNFIIGAGGPVAGTLGALLCLAIAPVASDGYPRELLGALGYSALILNLFNLMPIGFLDGGRMAAPISRRDWIIGYVALVAGSLLWIDSLNVEPNGVAVIVLLIGFIQLIIKSVAGRRRKSEDAAAQLKADAEPAPKAGTPRESLIAGLVYFGLAGSLIGLVHWYLP